VPRQPVADVLPDPIVGSLIPARPTSGVRPRLARPPR
jgi:hypothetical protein